MFSNLTIVLNEIFRGRYSHGTVGQNISQTVQYVHRKGAEAFNGARLM